MASTFPTTLDAFTNPTGADNLSTSVGGRTHPQLHADIADAMEAVQAKLGITSSAVTTSHDYLLARLNRTANKFVSMIEDFDTASSRLAGTTTGSGASIVWTAAESGRVGIATLGTGTTTTGKAALGQLASGNIGTIVLGAGEAWLENIVRVPTVSDATETFYVRAGFMDAASGADSTDGVYFRYTHSVNTGKWECITRSNSVETATDSGVTVVAGTWYKLLAIVNAAGTSVSFYIATGTAAHGAAVQTHTTNIPTTTARATGYGVTILKSAGTTSRTFDVDKVQLAHELTTER